MYGNTLHLYVWSQILASLRSSIIAHVWTRTPWCSNLTIVNQSKGAHYKHRIFAHCMHIWAWHRPFPQFYCLTFGVEPTSGLPQSRAWSADPRWVGLESHSGNSMGPLKWSRIYIPWNRSENIQIGKSGAFIRPLPFNHSRNQNLFFRKNNFGNDASI